MSWRYEERTHAWDAGKTRAVPVHLVFKKRKGRIQLVHICFPHCRGISVLSLTLVYGSTVRTDCVCPDIATNFCTRALRGGWRNGDYSNVTVRWFRESHERCCSRAGFNKE